MASRRGGTTLKFTGKDAQAVFDHLSRKREDDRDVERMETCTGCGIRTGHTISCPVGNGAPDDQRLRALWRAHGGSFHGPNIETGTMPESILLPFLRGLHATQGVKDAD